MDHLNTINLSISSIKVYLEKESDSEYKNLADDFFPIGPQTVKEYNLDWDSVYQSIIEKLFQKSLGERDKDSLDFEILESFRNSRDTRDLAEIVDELYLSSNAIKDITPLAYLVNNHAARSARTKTMINVFEGLITGPLNQILSNSGNNPIESMLIEKFNDACIKKNFDLQSNSYMPFLSEIFSKDIKTLAKTPSYFLSELETFIKLYVFIYLTQLTIHVCIAANRYEEPCVKPLYFILETERASKERHECNEYGYDYLFSKTKGHARRVFPILGYYGRISEKPIWEAIKYESRDYVSKVNEFNRTLANLFGEEYQDDQNLQFALNKGAEFQWQIFEENLKKSKKGSRKTANKKVIDIFEKVLSSGYITDRKAAGKYLVLSSRVIILLTNLVIRGSSEEKLLIDDVIEGFKQRGIWLDLKSKKALLKFYEHVGNIEKLSDSGDAVYVKTTF